MKKNFLSIHEPVFIGNEKKYLKDCINDGWVSTSGKYIDSFEKKLEKFTNTKFVVCLNSCTSALHLSLKLLNISANDEIIVPSITFVSPINSVLYNSSYPVFMDCDKFCNIDVDKTINFLKSQTITKTKNGSDFTINKVSKRIVAAIIIVHTFGNSANIYELVKICRDKNIKIIEDAAEGLGSYNVYKKRKYHLGTIGDLGCVSFNGNKIITSGGGGAILTNNKLLFNKAKHISNQSKSNQIYSKHNMVGYNYRINNIQAALGLAQIENINFFIKNKKLINEKYKYYINRINKFSIMNSPHYSISNNWINILELNVKKLKINKIFKIFSKKNIQTRSIWYPNHLHPYLKKFQSYHIDNAMRVFQSKICLPSSSNLKISDIKKISEILKKIST